MDPQTDRHSDKQAEMAGRRMKDHWTQGGTQTDMQKECTQLALLSSYGFNCVAVHCPCSACLLLLRVAGGND